MEEKAIEVIKEELHKRGIKIIKIILFGSRARRDYKEDSDWDFFVVVDKELEPRLRREIIGQIQISLAYLKIPNDIFIISAKQVQERENDVGHIAYYALKEGIEL